MWPIYLVAAILVAAIGWYFLRADPKQVDHETDEFYDRLYRQDSRR